MNERIEYFDKINLLMARRPVKPALPWLENVRKTRPREAIA